MIRIVVTNYRRAPTRTGRSPVKDYNSPYDASHVTSSLRVGAFLGRAAIPDRMERLHARYPFLEASREAVEAADVDLAADKRTDPEAARDVRCVIRIIVVFYRQAPGTGRRSPVIRYNDPY